MNQYLSTEKLSINPKLAIGKGGEADIYRISANTACKIFKQPNHTDYINSPKEQEAARAKIEEHQTKLIEFPKNLHPLVLEPRNLVTSRIGGEGSILGYSMDLIENADHLHKFLDKRFRSSIDNNQMTQIFRILHDIVETLHRQKVIIGDFNDLNVLVKNNEPILIDTDSMQFGNYLCKMFTSRFLDPTLCNPKLERLILGKPYTTSSDWYSFCVMLMQCLIYVDPYGGIYAPQDKNLRIPQTKRAFKRITIFDEEVRYPKPAIPYNYLPDDLLQYFFQIFNQDLREDFPINILDNIRWTTCSVCGREHARALCPECSHTPAAAIKETIIKKGNVTANKYFKTPGNILHASYQSGELRWIYYENNQLMREDQSIVNSDKLNPHIRYRIKENRTFLGQTHIIQEFSGNHLDNTMNVDSYNTLPVFDTNSKHLYWIENGRLLKSQDIAPMEIGKVLDNQTLFWVGENFGFGFYRASHICIAFVFDAETPGINDSIHIKINGNLMDSTCSISKELCWLFTKTKEGSELINRCMVIDKRGNILAEAADLSDSHTWLGEIRGKCAINNFLFSSTNFGMVRLEIENKMIKQTREYPNTEPFMDSKTAIFPSKRGLALVNRKEIMEIQMQ